jgi:Tol biopolymer transport system component
MPDIFLSYSREDQAVARRFAEAFERAGLSVWWDQALSPGEAFDQVTEQALEDARAVIVLWSKASVQSRWVRAEATQANAAGTLMPVMIEDCKRPIMFELTHTAELSQWKGNTDDAVWQAFVAKVRRLVQKGGSTGSTSAATTVLAEDGDSRRQQASAAAMSVLLELVTRLVTLLRRYGGRITSGAACAALAASIAWKLHPQPAAPQVTAFSFELEDTVGFPHGLSISPDGKRIVYASESNRLYVHHLENDTTTPIPGVALPALTPFFSFDGREVGYYAPNEARLKASDFTSVRELAPVSPTTFTVSAWSDQDKIYFGYNDGRGLYRLGAGGGNPETFVVPTGQYQRVQSPSPVPGGWVLYAANTLGAWSKADILARNAVSGATRPVLKNGYAPHYLSSGHLLFMRDNTLYAVAFDARSMTTRGREQPVMENVRGDEESGYPSYDVSASGTLAYFPDNDAVTSGLTSSLVLLSPGGELTGALAQDVHAYGHLSAAPDGSKVAVEVTDKDNHAHLWILDRKKKTVTQLTFDGDEDRFPVWTGDSQEVFYTSRRGTEYSIYRVRADRVGLPHQVVTGKSNHLVPSDVHNQTLIYQDDGEAGGRDILAIDLGSGGGPRTVLATADDEFAAKVSPDGKWVVYVVQFGGVDNYKIFVRPYPDAQNAVQTPVVEDGVEPHWAKSNGNGIYFIGFPADATKRSVQWAPVEVTAKQVSAGRREDRFLLSSRFVAEKVRDTGQNFDLLDDGFVAVMKGDPVSVESATTTRPRLKVVVNWIENVKKRVPVE